MNSLVVFLSVVAVAVAKPSVPVLIPISAPIVAAAPAAVSHQSRVDIKSSPALVSTAAIAPVAQAAIVEPAVYASPAVIAPAAVSSQSRIDIKSSPAITSTIVSAPAAIASPVAYSAPILEGVVAPTLLKTAVVAPGLYDSVALTNAISPSAPLETPEVLAARAAHFEAKTLSNANLLQKSYIL